MTRLTAPFAAKRAALWSAAAALAAAAGACASNAETTRPLPAWFVEQQAALEKEGYPRLENVPDRVDATVDQGHWDAVTRELDAAAAEMLADPRSAPAVAGAAADADAAAFTEAARRELEATGAAHGAPASTVPPSAAPADPAAAPPPPPAPAQDASTPE
ncbi:MAG: hypothetical protein HXY28_13235 [Hydrogenophilaceae bacterium]|jgi:hypothetical protein|nr:hypothetical protein [Hydrogenophilaceae bacterium]